MVFQYAAGNRGRVVAPISTVSFQDRLIQSNFKGRKSSFVEAQINSKIGNRVCYFVSVVNLLQIKVVTTLRVNYEQR